MFRTAAVSVRKKRRNAGHWKKHHYNKAARRASLFACVPNCKPLLRKISAIFIITVYLTASARTVPDALSHSPTSDSKPSAWSHQSSARIMILCIKVYARLCVWRVYLLCMRRHASAPLDSSTDRTRIRTLPFVIKANEYYVCMQHFKCASPIAFTPARVIDEAHVD